MSKEDYVKTSSLKCPRFGFAGLLAVFLILSGGPLWAVEPPQRLKGYRTEIIQAPDLGEVEKDRRFHLAVVLPLRNTGELDQFLKDVYDQKSPIYRHFLRPGEFAGLYGPAPQDAQSVADYFAARGFTVTKIHSNRVIVDVEGDNDAIEKAFHVRLHNRRRPDGTTFFAPDGEPQVDLDTPLDHVSGLENFQPPRRAVQARPMGSGRPLGGSAPSGTYYGIDFRNAYAANVTLRGDGQSIAFFELSTYTLSDIQTYQSLIPGTNAQSATMYASFGSIQNVYVDGINPVSNPPTANAEVVGDVECASAMAPAATMVVYQGETPDDVLNQIADDDTCQQISSSWVCGIFGTGAAQLAAQGQSYLQAAGDWEYYDGPNDLATGADPDDTNNQIINLNQSDVTLVGGTELSMNGTVYGNEMVWNNGAVGTGGGVLNYEVLPFYQSGMNFTAVGGSTTNRNAPDVAAIADNLYIENGGSGEFVYGTSLATPIWAGFIALANQQGAAQSNPSLGFLNPILYAIGQDPVKYAADFHDITSGNNEGYNAATGFDLTTGWGSPNSQGLINDLLQTTGIPSPTPTITDTPTLTITYTPTPTVGTLTATSTPPVYPCSVSGSSVPYAFAGTWNSSGETGNGGSAQSALLNWPTGLWMDPGGDLYISDIATLRKVSPAGIVTLVAGNGTQGYAGDGGPAVAAEFNNLAAVVGDRLGNLYCMDQFNWRIRKISPAGIITTVAGNGSPGSSGDYGPATSAAFFPGGLAVDGNGLVYISDLFGNYVRRVGADGIIRPFAGVPGSGQYGGDGGPALAAHLYEPLGLAFDTGGNLYIADIANERIRKVDPSGKITTIAGTGTYGSSGVGGPATLAEVKNVGDFAFCNGNIYFTQLNLNDSPSDTGEVCEITSSGTMETIGGLGSVFGPSALGEPFSQSLLHMPIGLAVDPKGNLYLSQTEADVVWKVQACPFTATPTVSSTATLTPTPTASSTSTITPALSATPTVTLTATVTLSFTPTATSTPKALVVYPNPISGTGPVHVQLPSSASGAVQVDLFTVAFRCVKKEQFSQIPPGQDISVELIDKGGVSLANGLYYLRVTSAGISNLTKLLVLR